MTTENQLPPELMQRITDTAGALDPDTMQHVEQILGEGIDRVRTTMAVAENSDRGTVTMYHQNTGEASEILKTMIAVQLRKRLDDGRRAFDFRPPPNFSPPRADLVCPLHPQSPERASLDMVGAPRLCEGHTGFPSEFSRMEHFRRRHPNSYAAYQRMQENAVTKQQQDANAALLELLKMQQQQMSHRVACPLCDWINDHPNMRRGLLALGTHIRSTHKMSMEEAMQDGGNEGDT